MNVARLSEIGVMLTTFMLVLTFDQPYGVVKVVGFGLLAMILVVWKGK